MLHLTVILGSTRPNRTSEKLLPWLTDGISAHGGYDLEVLDLRDYPLPFYDQPMTPAQVTNGNYGNDVAKQWAKKIQAADAFLVVAPEYNHGYPAVLKNALDSVYAEWNNKPIAFVSYGSAMGARSVEQLRQVAVELQMAPIRQGVHILSPWTLMEDGAFKAGALDPYSDPLQKMLTQLAWWANALHAARTN
jgi:NAD(P)H-dependent FMN reductase